MAEQINSSNDDSKYRVALDLMASIMRNASDANLDTTAKYLELYVKCRAAVILGKVQ